MLKGFVPAIPTLLSSQDRVDVQGTARLIRDLEQSGADGVVVLGTTGEGMAMPDDMRESALSAAAESSLTVVAGCAGQSTQGVLHRLEAAADGGASYGLVTPPFYYPLDQPGVRDFFLTIADRSPIPILLYHIPQLTRNSLSIDGIEVLSRHDHVVGIKDSHGQAVEHGRILALQSEGFAVFQGLGSLLLNSYALGAAGSITPIGSAFPALEQGLRQALLEGDILMAADHQRRINAVAALFRSGGQSMVTNLKAVAHLLGYGASTVLAPARPAPDEHVAWLAEQLSAAGLLSCDH